MRGLIAILGTLVRGLPVLGGLAVVVVEPGGSGVGELVGPGGP